MKQIRGRPYLYFWVYKPRAWGTRRIWTYVGPVGRSTTRAKASELLIAYHMKVRKELDRRIERLHIVYTAAR